MSGSPDPWALPSAATFLDEIEAAAERGLVMVIDDPTAPAGLSDALTRRFRRRDWVVERLLPDEAVSPTACLGAAFGTAHTIEGLLSSALVDHVVLVNLSRLITSALHSWRVFSERFCDVRQQRQTIGLAIVLTRASDNESLASSLPHVAWDQRLRKVDVTIWADLHAPLDRPEPLSLLAAALASELCGWRLDLAEAIARASTADLLDPLAWLQRRDASPVTGVYRFAGREMSCPLQLVADDRKEELDRRLWRAQVAALFPWLEDLRQRVIARHRKKLALDDHLRALGVRDVEEIELGALSWQLAQKVTREEHQAIACLARIRNRLAHRAPALPDDIDRALSATRSW